MRSSEEQICRVCLEVGSIPLFSKNGQASENMDKDLEKITGVKIDHQDVFPKYLCVTCYSLLQIAVLFRSTAQDTDVSLRSCSKPIKTIKFDNHDDLINDELDKVPHEKELTTLNVNITFHCSLSAKENTSKEYSEHKIKKRCKQLTILKEPTLLTDATTQESNVSSDDEVQHPETLDNFSNSSNKQDIICKLDIKNDKNTTGELKNIFHCKTCVLDFKTFKEFFAHKKLLKRGTSKPRKQSAQNNTYICDVCGLIFKVRITFERHLKMHSQSTPSSLPYVCALCPYRGRWHEALKLHMNTHSGGKRFPCTLCPKEFRSKGNLSTHMATHKPNKFRCEYCAKEFNFKYKLVSHTKVVHMGIKDHVCDICWKAFGTKNTLLHHQRKVHKREKLKNGRVPIYLQLQAQQNV